MSDATQANSANWTVISLVSTGTGTVVWWVFRLVGGKMADYLHKTDTRLTAVECNTVGLGVCRAAHAQVLNEVAKMRAEQQAQAAKTDARLDSLHTLMDQHLRDHAQGGARG